MSGKTLYRALGAMIGWATLVAQYGIVVSGGEHANLAAATISYFSYFTILTNFLVVLAFTAPLLSPYLKLHTFFTKPAVRAGVALYIAFVAIVYHLLLRNLWDPQGLQLLTDIALHTVLPILYLLDWAFFSSKRALRFAHIPYWLIYPTVYGAYTIVRGALSGIYPYPFLNVSELGLVGVGINMIGFLALYGVGGAVFIALGRFLPNSKEGTTGEALS